jgi:mannitol-1-/sugar-/sorbitol-6-phosphatase
MWAFVVAGAAGTGKSTLGEALARRTGAVLLDLDTVTNPLLDRVFPATGRCGHWNDDQNRPLVRPARYAALLDVAADQTRLGRDVVLTAPFTAELQGGPEWETLVRALASTDLLVVWLHTSPDILRRRVRDRGELRDLATSAARPAAAPRIPHLRLDATSPTDEQMAVVLAASATVAQPD